MKATGAEEIARALGRGKEKREGAGWKTLCPAHADGNPSLSLVDKGGQTFWVCRVGCSQADVTAALRARGLLNGNGNGRSTWREETANGKIWGPITRYDIRDASGRV